MGSDTSCLREREKHTLPHELLPHLSKGVSIYRGRGLKFTINAWPTTQFECKKTTNH